jgi:hypothetical protein
MEFLGRRAGAFPGAARKANTWAGGAPGSWAGRAALALAPVVLRLWGCAAVRLATYAPVAMAVGVSVGYVRWMGVWARAWEGRAARGAEWDGMKWKERGAEWADGRLEREWDGRASGFDGALGFKVDSGTPIPMLLLDLVLLSTAHLPYRPKRTHPTSALSLSMPRSRSIDIALCLQLGPRAGLVQ